MNVEQQISQARHSLYNVKRIVRKLGIIHIRDTWLWTPNGTYEYVFKYAKVKI